MLTKKKKILILCTMLILLVVTGYLNIKLNNGVVDTSGGSGDEKSAASFFEAWRIDRTTERNEALLYWQAIIESSYASDVAKLNAEAKYDEIVSLMILEGNIEGLIRLKGYDKVLASCSDSFVTVVLQSAELLDSEVAQIVEIIQSQTNKDIDYIKIYPIE